jgi:hypothetical protein
MKKLMMIVALACAFGAQAHTGYGDRPPERRHGECEDSSRVWLPLGLSILTPPIQLPNPSHTVIGGMVNLGYGQMENVFLLDAGIINNVTHEMTGLELGAVNWADGCFGVQAGVLNVASTTVGAQIGVLNFTGDLHGVQIGVLNFSGSGGAWIFPIINIGF